jgi:uncharacterized protein
MPAPPATGLLAWVGLAAADEAVAVEFYSAAFGWEADREADHTELRRAGANVALVYSQTPQARAANMTSHWSPFFLVEDADLALERAVQAGGMALRDPFDVTGGRIAPLQDPAGAVFSVWARSSPNAPEPIASDAWWLELRTPDVDGSAAFYSEILGWRFEGIRRVEAGPAWSPFLLVPDLDEAARRAEAAGATSVGDASEAQSGRVLSIVDPQGAALSLLEPK